MSLDQDHRLEEVFSTARTLPPLERAAYLDEACGGNQAFRQEIESLLSAHAQAGDFLGHTIPLPAPDFLIERSGTMIGRYKLLQKIGEGGFGVVYMAEQVEPVQRKVALKIIKAGMDTKEVIARFEAERQALALMDHPGIANILDAGATEAGRPYFVMELVNGIPITDYCDWKNLPTAERLHLFMKVCHAVQHAHQKGIIHRDLKPTNVLVTLHDGEPVPKVIDFGVVKALGQKLTQKTLFTGFQHLVGTPAYMSPEQAELSGLDVDTRSDIYSLGVLLYELLTGMTPFDKETLAKAAFDEMRRMIRETEPPKPSTRLNTLSQDALGTVAAKRQAEPTKLNRLVRGDLDWIVMKCLEKDRARRYETANNVALDIEHHLRHEPVSAAAPSPVYVAQKFIRRHRAGLAVAGALVLLLAAGVVVSTWQAVRATRAESKERFQRARAESEGARAEQLRAAAEDNARQSREHLVRLDIANGVRLMDEGDFSGALLWLAEAAKLDVDDPARRALHRLRLDLVLRWCPRLTQVFFHSSSAIYTAFSRDGSRIVTVSYEPAAARIWSAATGELLAPPLQHERRIYYAEFSPDGRRVVTASADGTARVWAAMTGQPLTPPLRHHSSVRKACFSPDGRLIVTASDDHTARLWDASSGQSLSPPFAHGEGVIPDARFSPDGKYVVTAGGRGTARLWTASGDPVTPPLTNSGPLGVARFSPDGRRVLLAAGPWFVVGAPDRALLWDPGASRATVAFLPHSSGVVDAQFSPDGRRIVTASRDGTARVWDAGSGQPLGAPLRHNRDVFSACFSPDGRKVATASVDATARVWDSATGRPLTPPLRHGARVWCACFSPDGRYLSTGSDDNGARLWDLASEEYALAPLAHASGVIHLDISPDGTRLVASSLDKAAHVWDTTSGRETLQPLGHGRAVYQATFSPDGRRLVTASKDGTARVWDASTGQPLTGPLLHAGPVVWACFSPKGERVVTASHDRTVRVWDATTGRALLPPIAHSDRLYRAGFSPDGRKVVSGSGLSNGRGAVQVWDAGTGQPLTRRIEFPAPVPSVSFNSDGGRLVTASWSGAAQLWDALTGEPSAPALRHGGLVYSAVFSRDAGRVVTASGDQTARVWNAATGEPVTPPLHHDDIVWQAAFSSDARWVVTASADHSARVWDAATGQPLTPPLRHGDEVKYALFSPDSRRVFTASLDGTVRVWDLSEKTDAVPEDPLLLARLLTGREVDKTGGFAPLSPESFKAAWEEYSARRGHEPASGRQMLDWHQREAAECERLRQWFGALFHLEKLLAASPADPLLLQRQGAAQTALARGESHLPQTNSTPLTP